MNEFRYFTNDPQYLNRLISSGKITRQPGVCQLVPLPTNQQQIRSCTFWSICTCLQYKLNQVCQKQATSYLQPPPSNTNIFINDGNNRYFARINPSNCAYGSLIIVAKCNIINNIINIIDYKTFHHHPTYIGGPRHIAITSNIDIVNNNNNNNNNNIDDKTESIIWIIFKLLLTKNNADIISTANTALFETLQPVFMNDDDMMIQLLDAIDLENVHLLAIILHSIISNTYDHKKRIRSICIDILININNGEIIKKITGAFFGYKINPFNRSQIALNTLNGQEIIKIFNSKSMSNMNKENILIAIIDSMEKLENVTKIHLNSLNSSNSFNSFNSSNFINEHNKKQINCFKTAIKSIQSVLFRNGDDITINRINAINKISKYLRFCDINHPFHGQILNNIKGIFIDICNGLKTLNGRNICSRDIKCENILITKKCKAKICDFGLSGLYDQKTMVTFAGTPTYIAPEILNGDKYSNILSIFITSIYFLYETRLFIFYLIILI